MQKDERIRIYHEYAREVQGPGKFERCEPYVPYYWETKFHNWDGDQLVFHVTINDRKIFPELKGRKVIRLVEDNYGFVSEIRR